MPLYISTTIGYQSRRININTGEPRHVHRRSILLQLIQTYSPVEGRRVSEMVKLSLRSGTLITSACHYGNHA